MTIVALTTIEPRPGVQWDDVQKQLKKACDLARKHGADKVTVLATMIGGHWAHYGQVHQALLDDPDMQAVMLEASQIATWESYISQTIPDN
jgi:sugar phosphate isomerase/epimerase